MQTTKMRPGVHAHRLIAETAEGMASAIYAALMQKNEWYAAWKRKFPRAHGEELERIFVRLYASSYIMRARATLAGMLKDRHYSAMHEEISEALILDAQFKRSPQQQRRAVKEMGLELTGDMGNETIH